MITLSKDFTTSSRWLRLAMELEAVLGLFFSAPVSHGCSRFILFSSTGYLSPIITAYFHSFTWPFPSSSILNLVSFKRNFNEDRVRISKCIPLFLNPWPGRIPWCRSGSPKNSERLQSRRKQAGRTYLRGAPLSSPRLPDQARRWLHS